MRGPMLVVKFGEESDQDAWKFSTWAHQREATLVAELLFEVANNDDDVVANSIDFY